MFKIGDKVWRFDPNRRVYPKDKAISGGPIYAEHFWQDTIVGETSRSWLVGGRDWDQIKVPKKNPTGIYTDEQKEAEIWEHDHRYRIVKMVQRCTPEQLKQIAKLIGYNENNQ